MWHVGAQRMMWLLTNEGSNGAWTQRSNAPGRRTVRNAGAPRQLRDGRPPVRRERDAEQGRTRRVWDARVSNRCLRGHFRDAHCQKMRVRAMVDVPRMGRKGDTLAVCATGISRGIPLVARAGGECRGTVRVVHVGQQQFKRHRNDAQQREERRHSAAR